MNTYAVNAVVTVYLTVEVEAETSEAADTAALDAVDQLMQGKELFAFDEYTTDITGNNRLVRIKGEAA